MWVVSTETTSLLSRPYQGTLILEVALNDSRAPGSNQAPALSKSVKKAALFVRLLRQRNEIWTAALPL